MASHYERGSTISCVFVYLGHYLGSEWVFEPMKALLGV